MAFDSLSGKAAIEAESAWQARGLPVTLYSFLSAAKAAHGSRPAVSFQLFSDPRAPAVTWSWDELHAQTTRAANLFRSLEVGPRDTVAYLLPNCLETVATFLGAATAGIANPINPLLEPGQIAAILRETNAKVLVTLRSFPRSEVAQKAAAALAEAPNVTHVVEVDLARYLTGAKRLVVPLIRPRHTPQHGKPVLGYAAETGRQPDTLAFDDPQVDRVAGYFHTGGTTGMPKVAQHLYSGMIYNGWIGKRLLFEPIDTVMCPLPLFHVFACYPVLMAMIASGAHVVFPTPAGYRGPGVFDNFWKLVARWQASFMIGVPTAYAALMQRPVDADISCLKSAFSGSSPMPLELYQRFEEASGVTLIEGYGLTEATCLVSCNPVEGPKRKGSVGLPFPHTEVRILGQDRRPCPVGEVGEICIASPGIYPGSTYTERDKNHDLFHDDVYLRTGDLGRLDEDGYLWITGRAKDLIIRSGHNIDPAVIEDCLAGHPAVAFAGAVGQPDAFAGELPCAYVELVEGAEADIEALLAHCRAGISERAAVPKYLEIVTELPKTAVGKVFKPDLRKRAIARVCGAALADAGLAVEIVEVAEDRSRGLVARLAARGTVDREAVSHCLGQFTCAWDWAD